MSLRLKTAAAEEPVSVAEFAQHIREDEVRLATDLAEKLTTAWRAIEHELNRALIASNWVLLLEAWPAERYLDLPLGNLQAVASFTYRTCDGETRPFAAENYRLSSVYDPESGASDARVGRLHLARGKNWPGETLDEGEAIAIEFRCGWKDAAAVPPDIKHAIFLDAAHLWRNRESVTLGNTAVESKLLARGVERLLAPYILY